MSNTVQIHRIFATSLEKLYRAFVDPEAMVKWLPPDGFTGKVHSSDVRVGGGFKMSFTNFTTKNGHSFGGKYLELVPNQMLRYTNKFDNPNMPGEMSVTVTFREVICGTELKIIQAGIPDAIPTELCYMGWQQSLTLLARLVEPDIKD